MPPQFEPAVQRSILDFASAMPATLEGLEDEVAFRRTWTAIDEQLSAMLTRVESFIEASEGRARRESEWEDQAKGIENMLAVWREMGHPPNTLDNRLLLQEMHTDITLMRLVIESNRCDEIEDDRQRASPFGVPILPDSDSD
ncbi:hypothetical protein EXIGLDRAFT_772666 [Exidia glandulosa HHB12029]|uniref:Uncharacterized protein n=1 Tax=Exidia glandulosa HHB12029 TaxID=1314781 RepID=A0A165BK89_EXIGL|nr:hypothetical protein EXIGLDRAFT_780536 [Exidia glandulosa HHB12029]KZV88470.1 hypothetical protein EXIGLDRAFT_772666 [Exidia glandulosa HHB12029]